jgi:serine protease Do
MHHDPLPAHDPGAAAPAARVLLGIAGAGLIGWSAATAAPPGGYGDLVERVAPAVVFIEVTATLPEAPEATASPFPPGSPIEEFFERFGIPVPDLPPGLGQGPEGGPLPGPREGPRMGVGSGFVIDPEGSIVTNNHVLRDAAEIVVRLDDGRSFAAEVVGTDPMTDLALLRIDAGDELPFVSFGDSGAVRPGDNVVAVGNPFGLGGSVTSGIVSAVARDINVGPYDDFIQIDAAINQGNSGGPLFNEDGEVIGVNTAIFSPTGGSVGIGFAVPANIAQDVISQLEATGEVERGWLGVALQPVNEDLAAALDLFSQEGALVSSVTPGSPAAEAGMEPGDVILGFNGAPIAEVRDLPRLVAAAQPGSEAEIEVHRGGERLTLAVTIAPLETAAAEATEAPGPSEPVDPGESDAPRLGLSIAPLTEQTRALARVEEDVDGVLVHSVEPQGPAAGLLRSGDVIVAVQGEPVTSQDDFLDALEAAAGRDALHLRVWRDGAERFVGLRPVG